MGWRLGRRFCLRQKILFLSFVTRLLQYKYGNYETCSSFHISYPCACSARFRRPSTALSGETNAALPRPSDHYRQRLPPNTTEQRAKITAVTRGVTPWCQRCLVGECSVISVIVGRIRPSKFTGALLGLVAGYPRALLAARRTGAW